MNHNILYKKKWVACGDSFTEGDFTGFIDSNGLSGEQSDYLYDPEWKMYKTYPYWIAKRNEMNLINEAICGSTMTFGEQVQKHLVFSVKRYQQIPLDTDYITLKFGINDDGVHKNMPIGSITDETNETFSGAWNVVMKYLIIHHPYAKIGIIVSNGCQAPYALAVIKIAQKWGISYFDECFDPTISLMHRVDQNHRAYLCSEVINLRKQAFSVTTTNSHPNIEAHKYESTMIENWMRSL